MKNIKEIKGDASFRKFFRKKNKNYNSIIIYSKKEKNKNLLIYDAINKILNKNKILAPVLYNQNYLKNYLEIEDFGNNTILNILQKKKNNNLIYFKKIIQTLNKIQSIKNKSIKNFKKKNYTIPKYNSKILLEEADLFCDWYIKENLSKNSRNRFVKNFKKIVKDLTLNLKLKNNVFVHRDFHISNLMLVKGKIGVLDSQDALIGNKAYDVASLIDDVRFQTSESFKEKLYQLYIKKQKKLDKYKFKNDFEILSVLRNLKIIGIFTRLAVRDGKKKYLKFIPYAWTLINTRINKNKVFLNLYKLLKQNFNEKIK